MDASIESTKRALAMQAKERMAVGDSIGALELKMKSISIGRPSPGELYELGRLQVLTMRYDDARKTFGILHGAAPTVPEIAIETGRLAKIGGDMDSARAIFDQALAKHPQHPPLLAESLSFDDLPADRLSTAEALAADSSVAFEHRHLLAFALAGFFDKAKDVQKAWHFATLGNSLYKDNGPSVPQVASEIESALRLFEATAPLPIDEDAPQTVYLIGPPRSGGTLLQTVLAAPDHHASLGERGALLPWLMDGIHSSSTQFWETGAAAIQQADMKGIKGLAGDSKMVIDKTPHHAHFAGVLSKIHPQSAFIDQRRDIRDTLVSIYLQAFKPIFGYSRNVQSIADYLLLQRQTVERWKEAGLPVIIHDHEAFVRTPNDIGKGLFTELGHEWNDAYLAKDRRVADVRNFSTSSVRTNISAEYTNKWSHYQDVVGDLPDELLRLLTA